MEKKSEGHHAPRQSRCGNGAPAGMGSVYAGKDPTVLGKIMGETEKGRNRLKLT